MKYYIVSKGQTEEHTESASISKASSQTETGKKKRKEGGLCSQMIYPCANRRCKCKNRRKGRQTAIDLLHICTVDETYCTGAHVCSKKITLDTYFSSLSVSCIL